MNKLKVIALLLATFAGNSASARLFTADAPKSSKLICGSDAARAKMARDMAATLGENDILVNSNVTDQSFRKKPKSEEIDPSKIQGKLECQLYQVFTVEELEPA